MLASQRQSSIVDQVRAHGAVRVSDLVAELGVSDMTVRRDIAELAARGLVRKVHGGAIDASATAHEPPFATKRDLAAAQKAAITQHALSLLAPGATVALSAGSTTHLLAELIAATPELRPLTVVTNSLPVSDALHRVGDPRLTTVLTGGTRTPSDALVGPVADASLATLRADVAVLGTHGIGADGLSSPNLLEASTNRALIACAARTVVLADSTKWGVRGLAHVASLGQVAELVTDADLDADARATAAQHVGHLALVAIPRTSAPEEDS